jgi:hypothetical protein
MPAKVVAIDVPARDFVTRVCQLAGSMIHAPALTQRLDDKKDEGALMRALNHWLAIVRRNWNR